LTEELFVTIPEISPEMGREEQKEEREVLDSIFPDEITGMVAFLYLDIVTNKKL